MIVGTKLLASVIGLVAAACWFMSAFQNPPPAPGAAFGGTLPTDPFNVALAAAAWWNRWAAITTGLSVLLMAIAELLDYRKDVRANARPKQ